MPRECTKFSPKRQKLFLDLLKSGESASIAAQKCHISVRNAYRLREKNAKFAKLWSESVDYCVESAETELRRRAVDGVDVPVFFKGEKTGTKKEFSDQLLLAYLRANRPEKYRDRSEVRHEGEVRTMIILEGRALPAEIPVEEIEERSGN